MPDTKSSAARDAASQVLGEVPPSVRPMVQAARRAVKAVAPTATEAVIMSRPPQSSRYMWKLFRYAVDDVDVVGIGTFPRHSTLFFYRGRELDDGSGLLEGGGKEMRSITLRSPANAERPAVKQMLRKAFKLAESSVK